jgi:hypothetical protein
MPPDVVATVRRVARALADPRGASRNGRARAVTLLTPIVPGQTAALKQVLRDFETGDGSPLAQLSGLHFGRWVVIDGLRTQWPGAPEPPPKLRSHYLMFTADVMAGAGELDALPDSFFTEIAERIPAAAEAVWRHCLGYPGVTPSAAFVRYLGSSTVDAGLYYAAYPDATVEEIRKALCIRRSLAEFVRDHPNPSQAEYLEAATGWCSST